MAETKYVKVLSATKLDHSGRLSLKTENRCIWDGNGRRREKKWQQKIEYGHDLGEPSHDRLAQEKWLEWREIWQWKNLEAGDSVSAPVGSPKRKGGATSEAGWRTGLVQFYSDQLRHLEKWKERSNRKNRQHLEKGKGRGF